ncbi:MAG: diguanylate cyclase [Spirochaetaceae bacterium]
MSFRLGLQISQLDMGYNRRLIRGVQRYVEERHIDLRIFVGRSFRIPHGFDYQKVSVYNHIHTGNVDGLLVASGTQCNYVEVKRLLQYVEHLSPLPVVSLGIDLPGYPSVCIDDAPGMRHVLAHLVDDHGCRRIALINGPQRNPQAASRFRVFREFLTRRQLYDSSIVLEGDFLPQSAERNLREHLHRNGRDFDAILALNDHMAVSALQVLAAHGVHVPDHVLVAGYDNVDESMYAVPPLTTVDQHVEQQAYHGAALAVRIATGEQEPANVTLPTEIVIRSSCGCLPEPVATLTATDAEPLVTRSVSPEVESIQRILGTVRDVEELPARARRLDSLLLERLVQGESLSEWDNALTQAYRLAVQTDGGDFEQRLLLERAFQAGRALLGRRAPVPVGRDRFALETHMLELRTYLSHLISLVSLDTLAAELPTLLSRFDVASCAIVVYEHETRVHRNEVLPLPAEARLLLAYDESGVTSPESDPDKRFDPRVSIVPEETFSTRPRTLIAYTLHHREQQFGYILLEPGTREGSIYEVLCMQVAATIHGSMVYSAKEKAEQHLQTLLEDLEEQNRRLNDLSHKDELTGVLNRRGFIEHARDVLDLAFHSGAQGVVLFADLNDLKKINDTFGHDEGDKALQAVGRALHYTFRTSDVIGRLGGDEFAILALDLDAENVERVCQRLHREVRELGKETSTAYTLGVSIGSVAFHGSSRPLIEELLNEADKSLYRQKRDRRK